MQSREKLNLQPQAQKTANNEDLPSGKNQLRKDFIFREPHKAAAVFPRGRREISLVQDQRQKHDRKKYGYLTSKLEKRPFPERLKNTLQWIEDEIMNCT